MRRPAALLCRLSLAVAAAAAPCLAPAAPADDYERGMQAYRRGDIVGAMRELRRGAEAGHASSQVQLAFILDRADYADESLRWYKAAAEQGDAQGHEGLATAYLIGRGVPKNEKLAWVHFSKAADLGHAAAIERVADAYRTATLGKELDAPPDAALRALTRAAERDHLPSIDALAQAYAGGGALGIAADRAQAEKWRARGEAVRKQRGAAGAAAAPKR